MPQNNDLNRAARSNGTTSSMAAELFALGRILDAMESGDAPLSPRHYRKAALSAVEILRDCPDLTAIRTVTSRSPSLRELLQGELMTRAAKAGRMVWLAPTSF